MTKKYYWLIILITTLLTCLSAEGREDITIEVQNYNTIRINGDLTETNNIDPEENKKILPFVLEEDKLDLLAGGIIISLDSENLMVEKHIIENLKQRGFEPDTYVYYSNDTKEADTICIYQGTDLIYYSRTAYNFRPFQSFPVGSGTNKAEGLNTTDYSFSFDIYPINEIDRDSAEYYASFSIRKIGNRDRESDNTFNDAEIEFNGIKLKRLRNNFFRSSQGPPVVLNTGDKIILSVKHKLLGEIVRELTVPPPINNLTVEPPLVMGIPNTLKTYKISWENEESNAADIRAYRADENQNRLDSYGQSVRETSHQWDPWELEENGTPVPYLEFYIRGCNMIVFDEIGEWCRFSVSSPSGFGVGNFIFEER